MKKILLLILLGNCCSSFAQNIGIGTTLPATKLHVVNGPSGYVGPQFPGMVIENSTNSYLNILSPDNSESAVLFGKVSDLASGGIIYNNFDNPLGFQFRTNGNITRMVITHSGNVGIGTYSPTAPLSFPEVLGKKITLYPGTIGDAGFAVWGNELRIASDYSGADITFGYDHRVNGFTEKFRMKANGALVLNGNAGNAGQVLQSGGAGAASSWKSLPDLYSNTAIAKGTGTVTIPTGSPDVLLPGLSYNFNLSVVSKVKVEFNISGYAAGSSPPGAAVIEIIVDGNLHSRIYETLTFFSSSLSGSDLVTLNPGNHTIAIRGGNNCSSGCQTVFLSSNNAIGVLMSNMIIQIFPQL